MTVNTQKGSGLSVEYNEPQWKSLVTPGRANWARLSVYHNPGKIMMAGFFSLVFSVGAVASVIFLQQEMPQIQAKALMSILKPASFDKAYRTASIKGFLYKDFEVSKTEDLYPVSVMSDVVKMEIESLNKTGALSEQVLAVEKSFDDFIDTSWINSKTNLFDQVTYTKSDDGSILFGAVISHEGKAKLVIGLFKKNWGNWGFTNLKTGSDQVVPVKGYGSVEAENIPNFLNKFKSEKGA